MANFQMNETRHPKPNYHAPLTAIRGLMAVWVVLSHGQYFFAKEFSVVLPEHWLLTVMAKGYLAVDFFFILSGFIMTYVYERKLTGSFHIRPYFDFILARIVRIFPLHWFMLALMLTGRTLYMAGNTLLQTGETTVKGGPDWSIILSNLLLIQNWPFMAYASWNIPTWSLSTEWFVYWCFLLLLPATVLFKDSKTALVLLFGLLFSLYWFIDPTAPFWAIDMNASVGGASLWRCLVGFSLGMVLHRLTRQVSYPVFFSGPLFLLGLATLLLGVLLKLGAPLLVAMAALMVFNLSRNTGVVSRVLSSPPLHWLGEVSYSLYLVHMFCFYALVKLFQPVPGDLSQTLFLFQSALLVSSLTLSHFTYHFIEVPCRDFLRARFNYDAVSGWWSSAQRN